MADAITYADLRFVKAPLKKIVSSQLGEDPEAYEDGELTYENVQVPSVPGGPSGLASSGLGDKSGFKSEQLTATWSSVTSPPVGRLLPWEAKGLPVGQGEDPGDFAKGGGPEEGLAGEATQHTQHAGHTETLLYMLSTR
uniref:CD72 molecule n=1 Tax=Urocitellus parryii TaxID=9999 RepID=A0A8D2I5Q9_UROPR